MMVMFFCPNSVFRMKLVFLRLKSTTFWRNHRQNKGEVASHVYLKIYGGMINYIIFIARKQRFPNLWSFLIVFVGFFFC